MQNSHFTPYSTKLIHHLVQFFFFFFSKFPTTLSLSLTLSQEQHHHQSTLLYSLCSVPTLFLSLTLLYTLSLKPKPHLIPMTPLKCTSPTSLKPSTTASWTINGPHSPSDPHRPTLTLITFISTKTSNSLPISKSHSSNSTLPSTGS